MNLLPSGHALYGNLKALIDAKRGRWTQREIDIAAKRFGIDRAKLAAAVGKAPEPKLDTVCARLEWVDRFNRELRLIDTGLSPKVASWIVNERDRDR